MADDLITDLEVSVLCDVVEGRGMKLNADKKRTLEQLVAKGLVEQASQVSPPTYKITPKAHKLLDDRGVGLSGG
jgi:hypothetical protein